MAEAVQRHLESMTEEIEELRRTKLYTVEETKVLLKRRKEFEYKINGVTKNLQDIKNYIQYEKSFLKQIRLRREKYRLPDKKQSIEFKVIRRVKTLYETALLRYPNDYITCLSFFKFCKQFNFHQVATHQIKNMLKMFSNKPEVFQVAAAWYNLRKEKNEALNIIHKGLAIHPESKPLYLDAINLEIPSGNNTESDNSKYELSCQRLTAYMKSIFENIDDFKFIIEILKILEPHCYTENIQNMLIDELLKRYPNEETIWCTIADRERHGYHYNLCGEVPAKSTKYCIERCIKTYREGIEKISDNKKLLLWPCYLDTLIDIQKENPNVASMVKSNALRGAFEEAVASGIKLEEKHYAAWVELCKDDEEAVLNILEKGNADLPDSCLLWQLHIKFYILKENVKEVNRVFKRAITTLKENAEPVWSLFISYHSLMSSNEIIEAIYLDAIKEPEQISNVFKSQYITWLLVTKGIKEARDAYKQMSAMKPYSKDLHFAMAKAEMLESPGMGQDFDEWGKCLHLACKQFGTSDADVWLNYIEFYLVHHKTFDANERIQQICSEAEKNLPELLRLEFKEKFNTLMAEEPLSGY